MTVSAKGSSALAHLVGQTVAMARPVRPNWRLTPEQMRRVERDVLAGYKQREIMARNGVSHITVIKVRRKLGLLK